MTHETLFRREKRKSDNKPIDSSWLLQHANSTVGPEQVPNTSSRKILLENRAALLVQFAPQDILDREEKFRIDDQELMEVLAESEIVNTAEGPRRRVPTDMRRTILKRLRSRSAMNEVLSGLSILPIDPVQRMFAAIVQGETIPIEQLVRTDLASLLVVLEWVDGILDNLPDFDDVRMRLAREDLLAPLRNLTADFVGRESELDQLRGYVGEVRQSTLTRRIVQGLSDILSDPDRQPPLFVYGIGGVGKSTLVARFAVEHAEYGYPFVFLDVDRPHLDPSNSLTLLAEAVRQLGAQIPSGRYDAENLAQDLEAASRNTGGALESESVFNPRELTDRFASFVTKYVQTGKNLAFIVDTFEEAQALGHSAVFPLFEMLARLQDEIPFLRPILSGRALPNPKEFPAVPLQLNEFDLASAERFLITRLSKRHDLSLDANALRLVVNSVEKTPLALGLAAQLIADQGVEAVRARSFLGLFFRAHDAAFLYSRILEHIPAGPLRRLAKPGLVLRRLSPGLIKDVLAGPCELNISDYESALALFNDFSRQASLVEPEAGEWLHHRADVRRLMLPALEREVGNDIVTRIDAAAVDFHSSYDDPVSRAEELYHRLRLGDLEKFEERWTDAAKDRLRSAREELLGRPDAHVALCLKLGVAPDPEALTLAGQARWERTTETYIGILLSQRAFEEALRMLSARSERRVSSPLYRQEAEALMGLSRFSDALKVAERGAVEAQTVGATDALFENSYLAARAADALGDLEKAQQWSDRATVAATRLGQNDKLFRAATLKARLGNWKMKGNEAQSLLQLAQRLLKTGFLDSVGGPATLRALAAAAGVNSLSIGRAALRRLGVERMSPTLRKDLAILFVEMTREEVGVRGARATLAVANKELPPPGASIEEWESWIIGTSGHRLGTALAELAQDDYADPAASEVGNWIVRYFQEIASTPVVEGATDIGLLIRQLGADQTDTQEYAIEKLVSVGAAAVMRLIEVLQSNANDKIRLGAIRALGKIGDPRAVQPLETVLHNDPAVNISALMALKSIGAPATEALLSILRSVKDRPLRLSIMNHFESLTDVRVVKALIELLGDSDKMVQEGALAILTYMGGHAIDSLFEALGYKDQNVRRGAMSALTLMEDPRLTAKLDRVIHEQSTKDDTIRTAAVLIQQQIEKTTSSRIGPTLIPAEQDGQLVLRVAKGGRVIPDDQIQLRDLQTIYRDRRKQLQAHGGPEACIENMSQKWSELI